MNKMSLTAFVAATVLAGGVSIAAAQDPAPQTPRPTTPPATAPIPMEHSATDTKAKSVSGELVKVDAEAKTIALKDAAGAEQTFTYNDTTDVSGVQDGVSGLATKAGTRVTVHFTGEGKDRVATKIQTDAKK